MLTIKVKKIDENLDNPMPYYATENASGLDISSASKDNINLAAFETKLIPTNLILEIPPGYEGQVRPRSGLAIKKNIGIINSPGTIDADYRGELKILLTNFGKDPFVVRYGDRIAQLIITKTEKVEIKLVSSLGETKRGEGGFGHSGLNHD